MAILSKYQLEKYHLEKYQYETDVRKGYQLYGMSGKIIYRGHWISKRPDKIIIVEMNETIAAREALFYLEVKDHKHIIGTIGLIENSSNLIIFIQEFAPHNDLGSVLMNNNLKISPEILREMFIQIADAMSYVARKRIVHGDLGCRNVLVFHVDTSEPKNSLVKITDFGLARWIDRPPDNEDLTVIPIRYCAPEILRDKHHVSYSEKSDVYSMGVLMWEALSNGEMPYSAISDDRRVEKMKKENEKLKEPPVFHPDLWKLMNECWYTEPGKRPTFNEIKRTLCAVEISALPHDRTSAIPHR
jgi:protein tyrosine kinase 6